MAVKSAEKLRLGVNIDHVATIRNARGGAHPEIARAAQMAEKAGADGITFHLREDRRHIRDEDLIAIREATSIPLNFEMAATDEMVAIATDFKPHAVCFVPEKREERTTEGGLNVAGQHNSIAPAVTALREAGARVSLFIEADIVQVAVAEAIGAEVIEFHTGRYCDLVHAGEMTQAEEEFQRFVTAAEAAQNRGLEVHFGHGITFDTVGRIAAILEAQELNIGHFLIGEAIFIGFEAAIRKMRALMDEARSQSLKGADA